MARYEFREVVSGRDTNDTYSYDYSRFRCAHSGKWCQGIVLYRILFLLCTICRPTPADMGLTLVKPSLTNKHSSNSEIYQGL